MNPEMNPPEEVSKNSGATVKDPPKRKARKAQPKKVSSPQACVKYCS
jgi:hypothetical protein